MNTQAKFSGGRNIAMKVPPHQYDAVVFFNREVLGFRTIGKHSPAVVFEFGANQIWIDRVPGLSQAEVWLEVITNDIAAASEHLNTNNVVRRDEIEPLDEGFQAFWISNPASIIHLICKDDQMA